MKIPKNWVGGGDQFLKKSLGETKRGGRKENTKVVEVTGFSYFNLLSISYHDN